VNYTHACCFLSLSLSLSTQFFPPLYISSVLPALAVHIHLYAYVRARLTYSIVVHDRGPEVKDRSLLISLGQLNITMFLRNQRNHIKSIMQNYLRCI